MIKVIANKLNIQKTIRMPIKKKRNDERTKWNIHRYIEIST